MIAMSEHRIDLSWRRDGAPFAREGYPRDHGIAFSGGQRLAASSAPGYGGNPDHADPEELLLAALSSCHMLTFIAVCANRGYVVDAYDDPAIAVLGKDEEGRTAVTHATLKPRVRFADGKAPTPEEFERLHERAHRACFIGNSVRTKVTIEPAIL
jgi:organic hydroperoxide reductase OsmC/OhrA